MTGLQISNFTSANRGYLKNLTALFAYMECWAKSFFFRCWKDSLLAELRAKMSRGCRFLLFWHHSYKVTLKWSNNINIPVFLQTVQQKFQNSKNCLTSISNPLLLQYKCTFAGTMHLHSLCRVCPRHSGAESCTDLWRQTGLHLFPNPNRQEAVWSL